MRLRLVNRRLSSLVVALVLLLMAAEAFASGFYMPGRGVKPLGRAGAFVATGGGDLNSLWYNPANLALLDETQLTVDLAIVDLGFEFQRAPRTDDQGNEITYDPVANEAPPELNPQILVGGPIGDDGLVWSFGLYAPYMSGSTYPEDGAQRYTLVSNDGSILAFLHLAVAYEVADWLRVGVGVQNMVSSLKLVNVTSGYTGLYGRPEDRDLDILTEIAIEDYLSPTANAGVWVQIMPHLGLGLSLQLPATVYDDDAKIKVRMPSNVAFDDARLSNDTVAGGFELPPIVRVGLGLELDRLSAEVAGVWEGWSVFDKIEATPNDIQVEGVPGIEAIPVGPLSIPMNYEDTFSVRVGGEYALTEVFTGRLGYTYETGAIPDRSYSVFLPDSDKHVAAGGLTYGFDDFDIDVSAAYYFLADRQIDDSEVRQINPTDADRELATIVGNGDYSPRYFIVGVGTNYRF